MDYAAYTQSLRSETRSRILLQLYAKPRSACVPYGTRSGPALEVHANKVRWLSYLAHFADTSVGAIRLTKVNSTRFALPPFAAYAGLRHQHGRIVRFAWEKQVDALVSQRGQRCGGSGAVLCAGTVLRREITREGIHVALVSCAMNVSEHGGQRQCRTRTTRVKARGAVIPVADIVHGAYGFSHFLICRRWGSLTPEQLIALLCRSSGATRATQ